MQLDIPERGFSFRKNALLDMRFDQDNPVRAIDLVNNLPEDETWIKVSKIGPETMDGKLTMDFIVSITQECTLCKKRLEKGLEPFCVSNCPTKALVYCGTYELLSNIKKSRIQMLK